MLRANVEQLIARYADLQQQVSALEQTKQSQYEEILRSHSELVELRKKYQDLQMAHALTAPSPDREMAKRRITTIITKIDQTLELIRE